MSSFDAVTLNLLYKHECFTGKYTTRKTHTKPHPGLEWRIFHILTSKDIDDFTDIKFVSSIVLKFVDVSSKHLRVLLESPRQSSAIFANLRTFSENIRQRSCDLRTSFGESSEIFGNGSEIFGKSSKTPSSVCLCNKKNITR